jgi:D-3-phosphoglycerate dehydrogenase / 2-oxoglutarate reductase
VTGSDDPRERVAITDAAGLLQPAIERLEAAGERVRVLPAGLDSAEAARRSADVEVAIVGLLPFGAAEIARLERTGLLIRAGIGYDIIDVEAASARGIWVANVPDYCVDEVADHTLLLLLAAARRLITVASAWRSAGRWIVSDLLPEVHRLRGRRLGVVGLGRIGRGVAARARGFGLDVVGFDPLVGDGDARDAGLTRVGLDELFASSDIVTLHCPLTPATHHLVDARRLAGRNGLILLNTSRGGLVDLDALDAAIVSGRVAAAALDVLDGEPAPRLDHPLLSRPEVLVTPHVAWYSLEARRDLATLAADEALRYLRGERPRNVVNPAVRQAAVG